jgi:hypothetical protein
MIAVGYRKREPAFMDCNSDSTEIQSKVGEPRSCSDLLRTRVRPTGIRRDSSKQHRTYEWRGVTLPVRYHSVMSAHGELGKRECRCGKE